jgi:hypothetical protein
MTREQFELLKDRWAEIQARSLEHGSHEDHDAFCVMEAVAYVAGEPWSDHPQCACPTLTAFMVSWNDGLPSDGERDRLLKPLIPQLLNTRLSDAVAERRSYLALDWLIRVHTPKWLDLVPTLQKRAKDLRALPEIVDVAGATAAGKHIRLAQTEADAAWDAARAAAWAAAWDAARAAAGDAAGDAAWDAARDAARDAAQAAAWAAARDAAWAAARAAAWAAARDAAGDAARDAAGDAAGDAARAAAGDAARDAAGDAAGDAARAAAGDAAGDAARAAAWAAARAAVNPTKEWLQTSALDLFHRMLAVGET